MNFRAMSALAALVALVSGCQSTSIRSAWFDTDFAGPPMKKIVVVGSVATAAGNRILEDVMVERLRAAGVEAIAGRTVRLDDPGLPEATFASTVIDTGAQGLLLVTLLGVDTRTQISTTMVSGGQGWGRGPWGGPASRPMPMVPVQQIRQYDLATVETKLYDVRTRQLVWAATTTTFNPGSVAREAPAFMDTIIGQLASRDIIARQ